MANWYSVDTPASVERFTDAWGSIDAPTDELGAMLLDVARVQIIAYAPDLEAPEPQPLTAVVTYNPASPGGDPTATGTYVFTRVGDVVTVVSHIVGTNVANAHRAFVPAGWEPADSSYGLSGGKWVLSKSAGVFQIGAAAGVVPALSYTGIPESSWTDGWQEAWTPEPVADIPNSYVYAQLQQAKNLWNAGRAQADGDVGPEGYSFTPRPLDKTIRNILRPVEAVPYVF